MWDSADPEHEQNGQGHDGDENGKLERRLHTDNVEADEQGIENQPPDRRGDRNAEDAVEHGADVAANPDHDHRRREDVFHVLGQPGDEAAPRPHRRPTERIGTARMRQRRGHLGDGIADAEIHDRDDGRRYGQAAKAADA